MRSAHLEDSGDCIKRLLCELQSKKDQDLPWDEILIKKSVASKIDYLSPILQLQLAVDLGTKQGPKQCSVVYSRLVLRYLKPVCFMKIEKKMANTGPLEALNETKLRLTSKLRMIKFI